MTDVVDSATRSRMMAGIQGKNTSPELLIRKALHARGFRFRIHSKHLPGKPDLILPKHKAAIFIHGCFWHGHGCRFFKIPKTRTEFWLEKIHRNQARDLAQIADLQKAGWKVLIVWECAVRLMNKEKSTLLVDLVADWLLNRSEYFQLDEKFLESECQRIKSAIISKA
ncbi:very short patch repair endonuclease [Pseudomonas syringae]|uniref:very short patch repair endonuclease n=1 Tax=Pseudomonas syringae TaxID=317 RepID=UPI0006CB1195|nr:DNA mismatch endonuclease Vsr [Pseudomonas syringae]ALD97296.1 DNA glycosylase [Pseudomonas syringae UMAF0158]MCK9730204.1 DNA mismatch endonuclease Vsr [Pseudomonas syringae pv. syringae]